MQLKNFLLMHISYHMEGQPSLWTTSADSQFEPGPVGVQVWVEFFL